MRMILVSALCSAAQYVSLAWADAPEDSPYQFSNPPRILFIRRACVGLESLLFLHPCDLPRTIPGIQYNTTHSLLQYLVGRKELG
ncbi:hypothetical protein B0J17DRAFT_673265 [Rhizoctonia solani]|nr:hypothetical protein B0J17DRAFT_673265 [Rhizoctonia solani]